MDLIPTMIDIPVEKPMVVSIIEKKEKPAKKRKQSAALKKKRREMMAYARLARIMKLKQQARDDAIQEEVRKLNIFEKVLMKLGLYEVK